MEYGKGKSYNCDNSVRRGNLQNLIRQSSDRSREILLSSELKTIAGEKDIKKGEQLMLATGGSSLAVKLGGNRYERAKPFFSHAKMLKLQSKLGLSDRKTKETAHFLRVELGRKSVQKGLEKKLISTNHILEDLFKLDVINYKETKPIENSQPTLKDVRRRLQ